ncbi:helix-turn-helix transcriptional regulator [Marixanthomonas ophiurae]|uniref:Fumarate hydratase n=1 Tax=Marixanthomonas ophiurae TaxID=387659 RepID=A0A3E1Q7A3_9FLAO|nr:fumarate hydratase [Marixanthomonas ophiurae]RFN58004.1 fumarate hydratase [Marixanthomonas ophiurae]
MMYSVLSGDIISSTSLHNKDRNLVEKELAKLLKKLEAEFEVYGRIVKGDYIECVAPKAEDGLRVALAIKSFVKSIPIELSSYKKDKNRVRLFKTHGLRLAIGYGPLSRYNPKKGVIDGEAIYLSGREISGMSTHNKERVVIKNTLFFVSENETLNNRFKPVFELLDTLLSKATARQSEVLYLKLLNQQEDEIAKTLGIGQSAVNRHSTSVGWNAIETAVLDFSKTLSK